MKSANIPIYCTFSKNAKIRSDGKKKDLRRSSKPFKTRSACHLLAIVDSVAEYTLVQHFKPKK